MLGVTDYWLRFEWQHRGSPHVHGLAWVPNAPDVEQLLSSPHTVKEEVIRNVDRIVLSQLFVRMAAMLTMHHQLRLSRIFAINHMPTFKTLTKISSIWLPRASDTHAAQQHTASAHNMEDRSATQRLYNPVQALYLKRNQFCLLHEMMAWSTVTTLFSCRHGVQMLTCNTLFHAIR